MADEPKTSRKMRSITSTFSLRDVAVVAVAAFTAAGPFFAYDTRISVVESKVDTIEETDNDLRQTVKELAQEFAAHLREYREERAVLEESNGPAPAPAPTNK